MCEVIVCVGGNSRPVRRLVCLVTGGICCLLPPWHGAFVAQASIAPDCSLTGETGGVSLQRKLPLGPFPELNASVLARNCGENGAEVGMCNYSSVSVINERV